LIVDRRDQRVAIDTSRSARVAAASGGKAQSEVQLSQKSGSAAFL